PARPPRHAGGSRASRDALDRQRLHDRTDGRDERRNELQLRSPHLGGEAGHIRPEPAPRLPRRTGMEHRAIALLVAIVLAFGAWQVVRPKPKSIDDPAWKCATSFRFSTWECAPK